MNKMIFPLFISISLFFNVTFGKDYKFGGQSMVSPLKKVLVRRPDKNFDVTNYQKWHYTSEINLEVAQQEHDDFVNILKSLNVDVIYHNESCEELSDSIFVHDPAIITDKGAIILQMGKQLRRGEEDAIERTINALGIPTIYKLNGNATAEGGDILWLDHATLCIGRGFRTNDEGIFQIKKAVKDLDIKVITVQLPYDQGKDACLHLQSLISLVDHKIALVYKKLLPVSFIELLQAKGFELIDVPDDEYMSMGSNVLAVSPKVCLTIEGNTETKRRLEQVGCKVYTYKGNEISRKAEGGATCLTRPLLRN